jgi:16S rRNA (cytosine967-C5)-methyltransferase
MVSPARQVCFELLRRIESRLLFSDDALNSKSMAGLEVRDRHLATEIVYGSLRWQGSLDYVLAAAGSRPWQEVMPEAKVLLRMSLYQLWKMDRIPDHALVNDAVDLAKRELRKGVDRYINAVLRHLARARPWAEEACMRKAPPWVQVSLPRWLCERWVARYGPEAAREFALSLTRPPRAAVRWDFGSDKPLPPDLIASDLVPGACFTASADAAGDSAENRRYDYQDEASQLIPHLLGPTPEWRIWDACAAPGGKCAILRRKCGAGGHVVASDLRRERILRLADSAGSEGGARVEAIIADAEKPAPFRVRFDAVLADVPCSGLGTLRRNPEIKWHFRAERLASLQKIQERILRSAAEAVREGGYLLYSTCSTEPEENEQVVESFLGANPAFSLECPRHPGGIERWTGPDGMVRTFPADRLWDGFFAALLKRRG